ncbi:MAG: hypothetical protein QXT72_04305 [Candidatus Micrarchaeia archaeon]
MKNDGWLDLGVAALTGFATGIASEGIVHYAKSVYLSASVTTKAAASTKAGLAYTITINPYSVGLIFALVGLILVIPDILNAYPWIGAVGYGMLLGGLAEVGAQFASSVLKW